MYNHILITGVAGFIGYNLAKKLLIEGYTVIGIDNFDPFYNREHKENNIQELSTNLNFKFYEINICDKDSLFAINERIDIVFHLAAKAGVLPSLQQPEDYISVNITGTFNILEFIRHRNIKKLIFSSSSSVYGNNKKIPFSENDVVDNPISPYAFTKKACELLNHTYYQLYKIDIINLRFFTVYGPRQRPDLAIYKFIDLINQNRPIEIYGDGNSSRDYTYIDDIVEGVIKAGNYICNNNNLFEIVNLGNNNPVKLSDLVSTIYEVMNKPKNIKFLPPKPGDVDFTFADIDKAKRMLAYNPTTDFRQGIVNFLEWYNKVH